VKDSRQEQGDGGVGQGRRARGLLTLSPCHLVTLSLLAAAALGALVLLLPRLRTAGPAPRAGPRGPRREYAGPFRNVHPDVRYVSDGRCAECHPEIAASYAEHPMGRSLWPTAQAPAPPTGPRQHNPFEALGVQLRVEAEGGRMRHRLTKPGPDGRPAAELEWQVDYVIGSGTRGYSYVSDRDGYLFQTPISWYSQKQAWDLSPGFGPTGLTGRAIVPECLFCHANRANYVEGTANHYARPPFDGYAVACQRCHGPGELHVERPGKGADGLDATVVNPKHLAPELRGAVCEQCHLQGAARELARGRGQFDFRPGLPLEAFWSVFLWAPGAGKGAKAVGQVEQMYESRCFRGSAGPNQLGCTSCHDPHRRVAPAERVAYYRAACAKCHAEKPCGLPPAERVAKNADSCVDCHMPRYGAADIPHTAATDHRVLRTGRAPAPAAATAPHSPIVSFYRGRKGVDEAEDERGRALALKALTLGGEASAARPLRYAVPALGAACRRDPDDYPAAEALGYALSLQQQPAESLAAFEAVLGRAPEREAALVGAALAAEALGKADAALGYWRRAAAANPWAPGYRHNLALLLLKREAWEEARRECDAWVRLEPLSAEARAARVQCLLAAGDKAEARAEFARLEALAPGNLRELQIRFGKKLR
jgi:predicted CXXCH cytochrome family protein